ncbi:exonuclease domain-containing protein [Nesterenkonia alba]|uniref:exonuclease domain-containing protein n=1 Tax=Nesterenkonia alba TaxID=515814 RepID=UPI0003B5BDED|nr:exonuclease domain-containing protein [Nesterenkonia alba]
MQKGTDDKKYTILFIDTETTGIDANKHALLEVAAILTDTQGTEISRFERVVHYSPAELDHIFSLMDNKCIQMHNNSGLLRELVKQADVDSGLQSVDTQFANWIQAQTGGSRPYLGGNNTAFDRSFLEKYLPAANECTHFRTVDVTSIWLFAEAASVPSPHNKANYTHRAMDDIEECVNAYRTYLQTMKAGQEAAEAVQAPAPQKQTRFTFHLSSEEALENLKTALNGEAPRELTGAGVR